VKKKIILLLLLVIFVNKAWSQADIREGYIITNSFDTINGLLKYANKKESSNRCVFFRNSTSEKEVYLPGEIRGYRFSNGKFYLTKTIASPENRTVFLEYIFDGIVDLYYFWNSTGDHYYISKNDTALKELKNEMIRSYAANTSTGTGATYATITPTLYEKESKEYIGVLKNLFKDGPQAMSKVESMQLGQNSLVRIAEDYHNEVCFDQKCIIYSKGETSLKFSVGPVIAVSSSNIFFKRTSSFIDFDPLSESMGLSYGVFLNIRDPLVSENFSMELEIMASRISYAGAGTTFKMNSLKTPLILKYKLPYKTFQPSALLGILYNRITGFDYFKENKGYFELTDNRNQLGYTVGAGADLKTSGRNYLFVQVRYEYIYGQSHAGAWDSGDGTFDTTIKNLSIVAGINF
jgi:hypothetical protein